MIRAIAKALEEVKIEPSVDAIADAIWLAVQIREATYDTPESRQTDPDPPSTDTSLRLPNEREEENQLKPEPRANDPPPVSPEPKPPPSPPQFRERSPRQLPVYTQQTAHLPPVDFSGFKAEVLRVPTAAALPGKLAIGRALRPLKQRVESRVRQEIDEKATADRIAEQQRLPTILFRPTRDRS